jgi:outer membrane protein assembly factor BamB
LYEGGPNATPTVDGDTVYALGKHGDMVCLKKADGTVVWTKNLQKETGAKPIDWGYSGSPLIVDDLLIVNVGTAGMALNKTDGAIVWTTGTEPSGYSTPVLFTKDTVQCVALFGATAVYGVEVKTGKEIWQFPWKTNYKINVADPIIYNDMVFISSGYGKGCSLFKITDNKPEEVWENKEMKNHFSTCILWKDHIYGFDGNAGKNVPLKCLEFVTGTEKWSHDVAGMGSLIMADGKLIYLTQDGELVIAEATPEKYQELAKAQILTGKCWTVPVLAEGRIYARNAAGDLVCVNVKAK